MALEGIFLLFFFFDRQLLAIFELDLRLNFAHHLMTRLVFASVYVFYAFRFPLKFIFWKLDDFFTFKFPKFAI